MEMLVLEFMVVSVIGFLFVVFGIVKVSAVYLKNLAEERTDENENHFFLYYPKGGVGEAIFSAFLWAVCLAVLFMQGHESPDFAFVARMVSPAVFFIPIFISRILLHLINAGWGIEVDGGRITYKSIFRNRSFSLYEIDKISSSRFQGGIVLWVAGEKLLVKSNAENYFYFIDFLEERLKITIDYDTWSGRLLRHTYSGVGRFFGVRWRRLLV
ncbi:MAG: hypothetical protein FWB91_09535 [Defluviitaleaceae bacterium]|nr:hypothetical protein [Defluviitaleaceae bacterium]